MKKFLAAIISSFLAVSTAQSAITYHDINVSGSSAQNPLVSQISNGIDFSFDTPNGTVGDSTAPNYCGNITILFTVHSDSPITSSTTAILGVTLGSGIVVINEVIKDVFTGEILSSMAAIGNDSNLMPINMIADFSRPSTDFRINKTFFLYAPPITNVVDAAQIALIEQIFIPSPGVIILLLIGTSVAMLKRNRNDRNFAV